MNILDQLAEIQWLLNIRKSNIQIDYEYDENQNIIKETYSGDIDMITEYTYNKSHDIDTEIITYENNIIQKKYIYDENDILKTIKITYPNKEGEQQ